MRIVPRILRIGLVVALTTLLALLLWPGASAAPQVRGPLTERIDQYLTAQLEDSVIPGFSVAVTRGDRVLMTRG